MKYLPVVKAEKCVQKSYLFPIITVGVGKRVFRYNVVILIGKNPSPRIFCRKSNIPL